MRLLLCAALLFVAAGSAQAADEAKPNTLTPQEIAQGWLLLFDGETTFGWKTGGPVKVENGMLILGERAQAEFPTSLGDCDIQWDSRAAGEKAWRSETLPAAQSRNGLLKITARQTTQVRNIKAKPNGLRPIFNAKDLTGWKVNPGQKYKSQFTVNDRGELNIKNGPGDLQTEGQWDNFILQLECISHGDRLNSGVFFRCRPNEYQQGYEAQIHNGFGDKPKEYTLDVYDPETHKLTGKKKESYLALDYGTGAIYRRQPARKQVSKDKEWFAMTVVAQGRHLAVWVNGIQVTDWTDQRPLSDNARNGCRLDKGPISLQGHDPTTDLSFRNIRIAALPKIGNDK